MTSNTSRVILQLCLSIIIIHDSFAIDLKDVPQDALPGGKILKIAGGFSKKPYKYGWTNGTCELDGRDDKIDISKIAPGKWFIAYREFNGASMPFLEPFSLSHKFTECTFFNISYDQKKQELLCNNSATFDQKSVNIFLADIHQHLRLINQHS